MIDVGRLDPDSPSLALLAATDQVLLLARASADDLAHVATRAETIRGWNERVGLLLVGDGYTNAEVAREVELPVLARIPTDPAGAATLTGHAPIRPRPFARATLSRAAAQIATMLAANLEPPAGADSGSVGASESPADAPRAARAAASEPNALADSDPKIRVAP